MHEGQISGKKIEPKRPLLDILPRCCVFSLSFLKEETRGSIELFYDAVYD